MMCDDDSLFGIELSQQSDASEPNSDWLGPDSGSHIRYSASSAANRRLTSLPSGAASASAAKASAAEPSLVPLPLQDAVFKRPAAASSAPKRASKKRVDKGADSPKDIFAAEEAADETTGGAAEDVEPARESEIQKEENQAPLGIQSLGEKSQELDEKLIPHLPPGKTLTNTHMGRRVPAGLKARCGFRLFQVKMMWAKYTEADKVQKSAEAMSAVEAIVEAAIESLNSVE